MKTTVLIFTKKELELISKMLVDDLSANVARYNEHTIAMREMLIQIDNAIEHLEREELETNS